MKKVYQEKDYPEGDCFYSCVSTLTGIAKKYMKDWQSLESWQVVFYDFMFINGYSVTRIENPLKAFPFINQTHQGIAIIKNDVCNHAVVMKINCKMSPDNLELNFIVEHDPKKGNRLVITKDNFLCFYIIQKYDEGLVLNAPQSVD